MTGPGPVVVERGPNNLFEGLIRETKSGTRTLNDVSSVLLDWEIFVQSTSVGNEFMMVIKE